MMYTFILKQQKRLLRIKRIINFVITDVSREEYFSIPVETALLYLIDYKRSGKIVQFLVGLPRTITFCLKPLIINDFGRFYFVQVLKMYARTPEERMKNRDLRGHQELVYLYFP